MQFSTRNNNRSTAMVALAVVSILATVANGFSAALFQEAPTMQKTAPSAMEGIDIELPDFDELFGRVQQVSPLARHVITNRGIGQHQFTQNKGFRAVEEAYPKDNLNWKVVEANPRRTVHKIDKIDNFQGLSTPILRFRSTLRGPCIGECFGNFIMNLEQRKKWDAQIEQVYELYPINDLDAANIAMGFGKYGDCSKLGVGYCQTKANLGITSREQLTLCGIQDFADSSCVIWGIEMEDWHDHMLPPGPRHTRARSHIFSTTLTPGQEDNTVDIEYVLQLDIGGKIPTWLTAPIVIDTVKNLFNTAEKYFGDDREGSGLNMYLKQKAQLDEFANRHSLLMTP